MAALNQNVNLTIRYDMPAEKWELLQVVYESMPGWLGDDKDGCPVWRPTGPGNGEISASVEPSGLLLYFDVSEDAWKVWMTEFCEKASKALGPPVVDADA